MSETETNILSRTEVMKQFAGMADGVTKNPTLGTHAERVDRLYGALDGVARVITEMSRTAPEKAPELWKERLDKSENIYDFIRRVYGEWLERGLRRSDLRRLDLSLYRSLYYGKHKKLLERQGMNLATVKEDNDRLLAQLDGKVSLATIRGQLSPHFLKMLTLYRTASTRKHRAKVKAAKSADM